MERIESNPDMFYKWQIFNCLDQALEDLCGYLWDGKVTKDDVVFCTNATTGVNAGLRSLRGVLARQGKKPLLNGRKRKILTLSTVYPYVNRATDYTVINEGNLEHLNVEVAFPISERDLLGCVEAAILKEKRDGGDVAVAIFDLITSIPGVINPFQQLVRLCRSHSIFTIIDGAHAVGQIPIPLGPDFQPDMVVSNLHKWFHTSRGAAVLYIHPNWRGTITPAVSSAVGDDLEWRQAFHWVGTLDPSSFLSVSEAIRFRRWLGGEEAIMRYCHDLAVAGGRLVADMWGTEVMRGRLEGKEVTGGDGLIPAMVNVRIPSNVDKRFLKVLQEKLMMEKKIAAQIGEHGGKWWARLSAQVYVELSDFETVAKVMMEYFKKGGAKL
ncbi:hypothetical protein HK101_000890 [Irineochytrium annulatum]|nr:hypothetical protein HK101_000890 [Irineochytrium annulatum]